MLGPEPGPGLRTEPKTLILNAHVTAHRHGNQTKPMRLLVTHHNQFTWDFYSLDISIDIN